MSAYRRLTEEDRIEIYAGLKAGESLTALAGQLGFNKSTISREVRRSRGLRGYHARQAHRLSLSRQHRLGRRWIPARLWRIVEAGLRPDWSPEHIAGVMRLTGLVPVSHERVYQYVCADKGVGGPLRTHLRVLKRRRKRRGVFNRRGQIKNRVWISERPDIVAARAQIGDWEVDTIVGKQNDPALITLTERKSRLCRLAKVQDRTAASAQRAISKTLTPQRDHVHTLTYLSH